MMVVNILINPEIGWLSKDSTTGLYFHNFIIKSLASYVSKYLVAFFSQNFWPGTFFIVELMNSPTVRFIYQVRYYTKKRLMFDGG